MHAYRYSYIPKDLYSNKLIEYKDFRTKMNTSNVYIIYEKSYTIVSTQFLYIFSEYVYVS